MEHVDDYPGAVVLAARDKKRTTEGVRFVLLPRPGDPRPGEQVDPPALRDAVEELR